MVISYEIYETSLWRVEMTTSVGFCLSYGPFKWDFITVKIVNISRRKRFVDTDVVNDIMSMRKKCSYMSSHTIFMTRRYSLNNSDVI